MRIICRLIEKNDAQKVNAAWSSPPPFAALRGRRAPPSDHACGGGRCYVPASALTHGRRLGGGHLATLRDPPHTVCAATYVRRGRNLWLASILGGAPAIPSGRRIRDAQAWGGVIFVRQGMAARRILLPMGAPRSEADALAGASLALHLLVSCLGGPGAGHALSACPTGVRCGGQASPKQDFLGLRYTFTWAVTGRPPNWIGAGLQLQSRLPAVGTAARFGVPPDPPVG